MPFLQPFVLNYFKLTGGLDSHYVYRMLCVYDRPKIQSACISFLSSSYVRCQWIISSHFHRSRSLALRVGYSRKAHGIELDGRNGFLQLRWCCVLCYEGTCSSPISSAATDSQRKVPEAWYPYTFDIFGGSHQIFHIMIIFAGLAHMFGLLQAFDTIHTPGLQCL